MVFDYLKASFFNALTSHVLKAVEILVYFISWHILVVSCSGINFIIISISFRWHGRDNNVTTKIQPVRRLLGDERAEVSVNCLASWSLITYQISVQTVQPFP